MFKFFKKTPRERTEIYLDILWDAVALYTAYLLHCYVGSLWSAL